MDELFITYVPDFMDELTSLLVGLGEFFAGGVLIAFMVWAIGYAIGCVYRLLYIASDE